MSNQKLWAVHMQGPDEIMAMASHEDAEQFCAYFEDFAAKHPHLPKVDCLIIEWPSSTEEHAEDLLAQGEGERS
ncbi:MULTISPECIES: hypothetical protein [Pseudomonas]|uniref:Uncharacterized protein n=1 Tax=Pseudomonas lutea TaxID=243924 RepID=A0A9X8MHV9_9PSED|nr:MULTISPECIES: hypothetical protein [Pseudomonas]SER51775.1 hypothetical protein SAMN05216409_1331 [Pseudomonas lutea]